MSIKIPLPTYDQMEKLINGGNSAFTAFPKGEIDLSNILSTGSSGGRPFQIRGVGHDGFVYGKYNNHTSIARSGDGLETVEFGFEFSGLFTTGEVVESVTKTHHGYVVMTRNATTQITRVFFSKEFKSGYSEVLSFNDSTTNNWNTSFFVKDKLKTVLLIACYSPVMGKGHPLYMSKDGEHWELIRSTIVNDGSNDAHWHCVTYDHYDNIIWACQGDSQNAMLHYSQDLGKNWDVVTDYEGLFGGRQYQPTFIAPFSDKIILGSDITNSLDAPLAVWEIKKDRNHKTRNQHKLIAEQKYVVRNYYKTNSSTQYFTGPCYIDGNTIFVRIGSIGDPKQSHIIGSGDGGNTWHHIVGLIDDYTNQSGMYGPDINGNIIIPYQQTTGGYNHIIINQFEWFYK